MDKNKAKSDSEALMNAMLSRAEQMLEKYGEFIPFGGAMKQNGEIVNVAGFDEDDYTSSQNVIDLFKDSFRAAGRKGEYKATAIIFDVEVIPPGSEQETDAIAIALDHKDRYSVIVLFPYHITDGEVEFGETFAEDGENDIFGH